MGGNLQAPFSEDVQEMGCVHGCGTQSLGKIMARVSEHEQGRCDVEMNSPPQPQNQVGMVFVYINCLRRDVKVNSFDV